MIKVIIIAALGIVTFAVCYSLIHPLGEQFIKSVYQNELLAGVGRARHSVRAVWCQPEAGAHGVTRPTCYRHFDTRSKNTLATEPVVTKGVLIISFLMTLVALRQIYGLFQSKRRNW